MPERLNFCAADFSMRNHQYISSFLPKVLKCPCENLVNMMCELAKRESFFLLQNITSQHYSDFSFLFLYFKSGLC